MPQENTEKIFAYNDPNWIDSALKRCRDFNRVWNWNCRLCCNYDICTKLRQEEREKRQKEMEEALQNTQALKVKICESEVNANSVRLSNSPGMIWFDTEQSTTTYDMHRSGTWQVVDSANGYTTIRYVDSPEA